MSGLVDLALASRIPYEASGERFVVAGLVWCILPSYRMCY